MTDSDTSTTSTELVEQAGGQAGPGISTFLDAVRWAKFPYREELIHLFVGGSQLHGAKVEGYDDLDIFGVFVEPPDKILGLNPYTHFVWSTSGTERKNTADDVDICLYGLNKFAMLACKGNPSALHFLFAKNELKQPVEHDTWFNAVRKYRQCFLARKHASHFIGYAVGQIACMTGERSRDVTRPDLVEKYGFDTKYAMHTIRVLAECEELMRSGAITLPNPEKQLLIDIRTGKYTQDWVIQEANRRLEVCKKARETSPLPEEVDRNFVSRIIADAYREHWKKWKI